MHQEIMRRHLLSTTGQVTRWSSESSNQEVLPPKKRIGFFFRKHFKKHPQNTFFFKENNLPFVDFDGFFKWEFTSSTKTRGLGGESTRVSDEFSDSTLSFQVIAFVHSLMNTCGT